MTRTSDQRKRASANRAEARTGWRPCRLVVGLLALLLSTSLAAAANDTRTMAQMARPVTRPAGFPARSAVCFSSRWRRPSNAKDPHDTFQSAADFHATGFYWISGDSRAWFEEIHRRGYPYQGWLSTILPDTMFGNTRQQGRILNEKGELVTGPWMVAFKGWWGCMNSPEYRKVYLDYVKMYIDAGAESLQMDDPGENATAVRWGGCYCRHCKEKAARLGKTPPEIQRESTEEFYRWMRKEIDAYAGRHVPWSCNSHPGHECFYDFAFDFGLEELAEGRARPEPLYRAVRDAEQRGKAQMFTYVSTSLSHTRTTIALAYACGSQIIVPWDVYIATGSPRYFGKPEEYADLYGFARAMAGYLDGYEDAAVLLPHAADERYAQMPVTTQGGSNELSLLVRAKPGNADAPVVIHCVDGADAPASFRLAIDPRRFFGARPVTVDLYRPASYDRAAHTAAEKTKQFAPLAARQRLGAGYVTSFDVPPVAPWGMIVIAPQTSAEKAVWPPAIQADDASRYSANLQVRLSCATPGATIRYTLDGSDPVAASPVCAAPLTLSAKTIVRAMAFVDGQASATATATFAPEPNRPQATQPSRLSGLQLWLKADALRKSAAAGSAVARWPAAAGPAMETPKAKLSDGRMATAPTVVDNAIGGQPAVRFSSGSDLLVIDGFANRHLAKAFTIFTVTCSEDPYFGLCGNSLNGNGGIPRLYLTRSGLTYHATPVGAAATPGRAALLTFTHDGIDSAAVLVNGVPANAGRGEKFARVGQFGGGNLAMPFWSGNTYHPGDAAEIVIFDRQLSDAERAGIEQYLAEKYRLRTVRMWQ